MINKVRFSTVLSVVCVLILLGAGCTNSLTKDENSISPVSQSDATVDPIIEKYQKWAIPSDQEYLDVQSVEQDCIKLANGETYGKDLLSTLIVDKGRRESWNTKMYTQEYLIDLEEKFSDFAQKNFNVGFYASSVCHIGPNIDVASGLLSNYATMQLDYSKDRLPAVFVRNNDRVFQLPVERFLNGNPTGGESFSCNAELQESYILWSCFIGFTFDKGNTEGATGSEIQYWRYDMRGNLVKTWNEIEPHV